MRIKLTLHKSTNRKFFFSLLAISLILTITSATSAQEAPPPKAALPTVNKVEGDIALYHTIAVQIDKLPEWITQHNDLSKFVLYIDGNAIKGLKPASIDNNTKLRFDLNSLSDNSENKAAWKALLNRKQQHFAFTRSVPVTVGLENEPQFPSDAAATLIIIDKGWFYAFVISFAALLALFWWLAYKSDILRDPGPQPEGNARNGKPNRKPYSLGRTQMALWFFVVIIAYVFIWMVTSDLTDLTPSVLGLIGISAATGLGAAVVDSSKRGDQENQRRVLEEKEKSDEVEVERLRSEIAALQTALGATPPPSNIEEQKAALAAKQAELAAKLKEIEQADQKIRKISATTKPAVSKHFIDDILSDDDGISFYRFQIFTWTVVLILIFIAKVYNVLSMPEFPASLLALMGISGGTFIGFKLPQQQG